LIQKTLQGLLDALKQLLSRFGEEIGEKKQGIKHNPL